MPPPPRPSSSLSFLPSMGKSSPKAQTPPLSAPLLSSSVIAPESLDGLLAPPSLEVPIDTAGRDLDYGESFYVDDSLAASCNVYSSFGSMQGEEEAPLPQQQAPLESQTGEVYPKEAEEVPSVTPPRLSLAPPSFLSPVVMLGDDVSCSDTDAIQDGDSSTPVVIPVRNMDFVPLFNYTAPSLQPTRSPSPPPPVDDQGVLLTKHNYHPAALPRFDIYKPVSGKPVKKVTFTVTVSPTLSSTQVSKEDMSQGQGITPTQGWHTRESNESNEAYERDQKEAKQMYAILSQRPKSSPRSKTPPSSSDDSSMEKTPQKKVKQEAKKKEHSLLFTSPLSKGVVLSPKRTEAVPAPTFSFMRSPDPSKDDDRSPVFDEEDGPTVTAHQPSPSKPPTTFSLDRFEQSCDVFAIRPSDMGKVDSQQLTPEVVPDAPEEPGPNENEPEDAELEGIREENEEEDRGETLLSLARRLREKMLSPPVDKQSPPKTLVITPPCIQISQESSEYSALLVSPIKGDKPPEDAKEGKTDHREVISISDESKDSLPVKKVEKLEKLEEVSDSNCNLATLLERRQIMSESPRDRASPAKGSPEREESESSSDTADTPISPPPAGVVRKRKVPTLPGGPGSGILVRLSSNSCNGKSFTPLFNTPPRTGVDEADDVTPERQKMPPRPITPPAIDLGLEVDGPAVDNDTPPKKKQKKEGEAGSTAKAGKRGPEGENEAPQKKRRSKKKEPKVTLNSIGAERVDFAAATKECALCKVNTDDTERLATLGELMEGKSNEAHAAMIRKCVGRRSRPIPLELFREVMYFHWHCLRYAHLSVDDHDALCASLTEGYNTECAGCLEHGATVKCNHSDCNKHYHLPCALLVPQVLLNNKKGRLFCPDHHPK
eukprot:TRINITY_DN1138_c0_g1_i2.p1 TRINITY_DN1138_c0_g1~~TRINITY_DN1138_c0_g1_i2.p1  ORF type:complete len:884 (+),score=194.04 TRINITY_DN1138_c0_g1_i2:81-2732(+)